MEDFIEYLKTFNGEFTKQDIYDIYVEYQTLSDDKDFQWLVDIIYPNHTQKQLIKEIYNWTYLGLRNKNKPDVTEEIKPLNEYELLYKERIRNRDTLNAYRNLLRTDARIESLKESIITAASNAENISNKFTAKSKKSSGFKEAILMLSDLHAGSEVDNFYNKYNSDIAIYRVNNLCSRVIHYCDINKIKKLNVVNLGDLISGIIHTNMRLTNEMDVVSQVLTAAEILANLLNKLQENIEEVVYRSCSDNHSRVIADKKEAIESENFGRLIDWYLKERLKNTDIIFEDDNIDYGLGKFELDNGKKVMFAHGHENTLNSTFNEMVGATREFIDYILMGHYHTSKEKTFNGMKLFVNGSIMGTDSYALSKRLFSDPEQTLLIFDDNDVNIININLK